MDHHLPSVAEAARALHTSPEGLDAATARQRLAEHGPNQLADSQRQTVWQLPLLGLPVPLLAIHILWIKLVSDGLPGLAMAYEPAEKNTMQRPPTNPRQTIFADGLGWFVLGIGLLVAALTIGTQAWAIRYGGAHWQTMTFSVLCFSQLGLALAVRSRRESLFSIGLLFNKPMLMAVGGTALLQLLAIYLPLGNRLFNTEPLTLRELAVTLAVSSVAFWVVEGQKLFVRRRGQV